MVRAKRIYILIIKVNKLFSLLSSRCLPEEIENMFSVFLSSCRNTRESLGLQLPACSHSISGSLWPKQLCNTCFAMCYGKVLPHPHVTFVWISLGHSNLAPKSNRTETLSKSVIWKSLLRPFYVKSVEVQDWFGGCSKANHRKKRIFKWLFGVGKFKMTTWASLG